jgi:hypothetical protein
VGIKRLIQEVRHTDAPMSPSCAMSPLPSHDTTSLFPATSGSSRPSDDLESSSSRVTSATVESPLNDSLVLNQTSSTCAAVDVGKFQSDGADEAFAGQTRAPVTETQVCSSAESHDADCPSVALNTVGSVCEDGLNAQGTTINASPVVSSDTVHNISVTAADSLHPENCGTRVDTSVSEAELLSSDISSVAAVAAPDAISEAGVATLVEHASEVTTESANDG